VSSGTRLKIAEEVVFRNMGGEAVLLHLGTASYFGLNAVGARVWQLLGEHKSIDAILPPLLREFDVDKARLRNDVETLVAQLLEQKLLISPSESD